MCRRGVEQMLADADEASHTFASHGIVTAGPALLQGVARTLSGDLAGGDVCLEDAVSVGENTGAHEVLAAALSERSLLAIGRGEWSRAEALAGQAGATLHQAGIEASYVTPLVCAVQARTALHRGDIPAARLQLVGAQRMRPVLTYAIPHVAVQARIELIHAHLALADLAGAKMLMRETDELLKRRPGLGTLVEQGAALRARLSKEPGSNTPAASSLTTAELRILPMLATHMSFPEIGAEMFLSPNTVKSQAIAVYRKLGASSRSQAVTRSRELGLLEG
jgi:LuxR family maltose regulon positive regulatory protein